MRETRHQEILKRVIQKAIDGGWNSRVPRDHTAQVVPIANKCVSLKYISEGGAMSYSTTFSIFDHDFAKALWGEEWGEPLENLTVHQYPWQYHLQQMVIADDPIEYLGNNF